MTESKKVEANYEKIYIKIPIPKSLVLLTTIMVYEEEDGNISVQTVSYGTKELAELEKSKDLKKLEKENLIKYLEDKIKNLENGTFTVEELQYNACNKEFWNGELYILNCILERLKSGKYE